MKKNFLLGLIIVVICSSLKNKNTHQKKDSLLDQIKITLYDKPNGFIWRKGLNLNLEGKITNNSDKTLILIAPKSSRDLVPVAFSVSIPEEFTGTNCAFEVAEDKVITTDNFWKILPNEEKEFYISGNNYFLNYCNDESSDIDSITVSVHYTGRDYDYSAESYFIKNNYKAE